MSKIANLRILFYSKLVSVKELVNKYKAICNDAPKSIRHKILSYVKKAKCKIVETVENSLKDFFNHPNLEVNYQKQSNNFELDLKFTLKEFEEYCMNIKAESIMEAKTYIIDFTNKVLDICFMDYSRWLEKEIINLAETRKLNNNVCG